MTERERLIELIDDFVHNVDVTKWYSEEHDEGLADYLLANGVIVPPCKVGDTVYVVSRYYTGTWEIYECKADDITIYEHHIFISLKSKRGGFNFAEEISLIGVSSFLTREEAEKALAEKQGKDEGNESVSSVRRKPNSL